MNDLFRAVFGIPPTDGYGERMDDGLPGNSRNNFRGNFGDDDDGDDDDDDNFANMRMGPRGGFFGFPIFGDRFEFHKHLDKFVEEMNKAFGVFGFTNGPSITWDSEGGNSSHFYRDEQEQRQTSLRDAYLKKPDCACDSSPVTPGNDSNISMNIQPIEFEPGTSNINSVETSYPKVYAKSVFIQTIRKPDGSVETVKKIRDHEGNEKTIISQSNVNDPLPPSHDDPLVKNDDTSGISIFKKFFSF